MTSIPQSQRDPRAQTHVCQNKPTLAERVGPTVFLTTLSGTIPTPPQLLHLQGAPFIGFLCILPGLLYDSGGVAGSFLWGTWRLFHSRGSGAVKSEN